MAEIDFLNSDLLDLRKAFLKEGFDIRIVGGAVRDHLLGLEAHDLDFCTNATPEQQIEVYKKYNIRYVETGLQHGTITVIKNNIPYEITSLRTEMDHDGRHASVSWTNDWLKDLERRDLTVNAMAMTFDGKIIDPFGGVDDLKNNRIRFVGDPNLRITEDYLRILRWLRFHGRLANRSPLDQEAKQAVILHREGLSKISRERIWSEMQKIISGPSGDKMLQEFYSMGLEKFSDMPKLDSRESELAFVRLENARQITKDPVALMACFLDGSWDKLKLLSERWKWSKQESDKANFLSLRLNEPFFNAQDGLANKKWEQNLTYLACRLLNREDAEFIKTWEIPVFPVSGDDIKALGLPSGPQLGKVLSNLRAIWTADNYQSTREVLLEGLEPSFLSPKF